MNFNFHLIYISAIEGLLFCSYYSQLIRNIPKYIFKFPLLSLFSEWLKFYTLINRYLIFVRVERTHSIRFWFDPQDFVSDDRWLKIIFCQATFFFGGGGGWGGVGGICLGSNNLEHSHHTPLTPSVCNSKITNLV